MTRFALRSIMVLGVFFLIRVLPCVAHPATIAAATAKVQADGQFTVQARFDLLAYMLGDTPMRIGDGPMNDLLDGPADTLQSQLVDASDRFRHEFRVSGDNGSGIIDTVEFPSLSDVQQWRDSGIKPRLPVTMTVTVTGHLAPGATTVSFRFPDVLGMLVVTTEFPYREPTSEPVEAGEFSTPLPLVIAPEPPPLVPTIVTVPPVLKSVPSPISTHRPVAKDLLQNKRFVSTHGSDGTRDEMRSSYIRIGPKRPIPPSLHQNASISPFPIQPFARGGGANNLAWSEGNKGIHKSVSTDIVRMQSSNLFSGKHAHPELWAWHPFHENLLVSPELGQRDNPLLTLAPGRERVVRNERGAGEQTHPAVYPLPWIVAVLRYVKMGYLHILPNGLDHILFVLGLFLLSTRTKALLWQITAFTVAHSITLGLALYGIVRLPSSIVEPIIAASIVFVAVENIFTTDLKPWRPFVVFAFGLVHGMGFAGALKDLGLQHHDFLTALVGFNVGVELGQLSVVLAAILAVGWFRSRPNYRRLVVVPASIAIAVVAVFWTFQRIL